MVALSQALTDNHCGWNSVRRSMNGFSVSGTPALSGFSLLSFQTLDLSFQYVTYESSTTLTSDQFVDPVPQTFRQTDVS